jgi:hypothetical protein
MSYIFGGVKFTVFLLLCFIIFLVPAFLLSYVLSIMWSLIIGLILGIILVVAFVNWVLDNDLLD